MKTEIKVTLNWSAVVRNICKMLLVTVIAISFAGLFAPLFIPEDDPQSTELTLVRKYRSGNSYYFKVKSPEGWRDTLRVQESWFRTMEKGDTTKRVMAYEDYSGNAMLGILISMNYFVWGVGILFVVIGTIFMAFDKGEEDAVKTYTIRKFSIEKNWNVDRLTEGGTNE